MQLEHLSKFFTLESGQRLAAVDDVCLALPEEHHVVSLIGPDGAGKSTLLKLIAGLIKPEHGAVYTPSALTIGYMSQNLGLYEDLSVLENLRLFARLRDISASHDAAPQAYAEHQANLDVITDAKSQNPSVKDVRDIKAVNAKNIVAINAEPQNTAVNTVWAANNAHTAKSILTTDEQNLTTAEQALPTTQPDQTTTNQYQITVAPSQTATEQTQTVISPESAQSKWWHKLKACLFNPRHTNTAQHNLDISDISDIPDVSEVEAYLLNLLEQVGLLKFKDYKAGSLSGGMKQKLALTCAISARPQLLILDEPTVGVDPISRRELWDIIYNYLQRNHSYLIFSSLYLEEAEKSDFTIFMQQGKVIYAGSSSQLKQQAAPQCFAMHLKHHSYQKLSRRLMCHKPPFVLDVCPRLGRIDLLTKPEVSLTMLQQGILQLVQQGILDITADDFELVPREPILEDAYINLTSASLTASQESTNVPDHTQGAADATDSDLNQATSRSLPIGSIAHNSTNTTSHLQSQTQAHTHLQTQSQTVQDNNNLAAIAPIESESSKVVINVDKIKKQFGNFTAVHDSSFKVYQGEIFGLLGPNGAGKTTTFRMICALLNPSSGSILINGLSLQHAKSSVRATIGYVAQKFCLYRKMTLMQNLMYFGTSYGLSGELLQTRIDEMCQTFGLTPYAQELAGSLPFGIQRSLSMACALIHKPAILFLDEATSGADPTSRRIFWSLISQLASQGTTIIVTTHFMEEAEYCDRFLIQDKGKILILGTPDEICQQGSQRISIEEAFVNCVKNQSLHAAEVKHNDVKHEDIKHDSTLSSAHESTLSSDSTSTLSVDYDSALSSNHNSALSSARDSTLSSEHAKDQTFTPSSAYAITQTSQNKQE